MIHNHSSGKHRLLRKILAVCIAFAMICSVSISAFAVEAGSETVNENSETVQSGSAEEAEELTATEAENEQPVDETQPEEPSAITGDEDTEEPAEVIEAPSEDTEEPTEPSVEPGEDTEQPADPTVTEQPEEPTVTEEPSVTPAEDADSSSDEVQDVEMEAQAAQTEDEAAALAVNDGTTVDLTGATVTIEDTIKTDGCLKLKVTKAGTEITADHLKNAGYTVTWYKDNNEEVSRKKVTGDSYNTAEDGSWVNVTLDNGAQKTYTVKITDVNGNVVLQTASGVKVDYYDSLQNGSFETPQAQNNGTYEPHVPSGENGIVWKTTGVKNGKTDHIELVSTSSNKRCENNSRTTHKEAAEEWHNMDHTNTANPNSGTQYAELNAESMGALYQDVLTTPGSTMYWSVDHNGRRGTDTMAVVIMSTKDAENITTQDQLIQAIGDIQSGKYPGAQVTTNLEGYVETWTTHSGQYAVPDGQYLTRYFFVAISTSTNDNTVGNQIDNVWFDTTLPPANAGQGRVTITKKVYGLPEEKLSGINKDKLIQYTANGEKKDANLVDNVWKAGSDEKGNYYAINYTTDTLTINANGSIDCTITENQDVAQIPGYKLETDNPTQTVTLRDSSGEREKTVIITNTYTPTVTDITVKKEVTGSMGDKTKTFNFTYSYQDENDVRKSGNASVKDGDTFTLEGVKIDTDVTLTETNAAKYTTSAKYDDLTFSPSETDTSSNTKTITVKNITADQKLITVTNNKEAIPDTGVDLNSTPYILMLGIMAAGVGVMLFGRRKRWS